jgi:hypothetical protein
MKPLFRHMTLLTCAFLIAGISSQLSAEAVLEVVNPIAEIQVQRIVPVVRPASLDNKRILLYWNRKLHADIAVDEIMQQLKQTVKGANFHIVQGTAWHPEPGFYEEIMEWDPDVVIASTGD